MPEFGARHHTPAGDALQARPLGVTVRETGMRHLGSQAMWIAVEADDDVERNARRHDLLQIVQALGAEIADAAGDHGAKEPGASNRKVCLPDRVGKISRARLVVHVPDVGFVATSTNTSVRPAAAAAVTTRAPSAANSCGSMRPPAAFWFLPPPSSASSRIGCEAMSAINTASVASSISKRNSWRTTLQPAAWMNGQSAVSGNPKPAFRPTSMRAPSVLDGHGWGDSTLTQPFFAQGLLSFLPRHAARSCRMPQIASPMASDVQADAFIAYPTNRVVGSLADSKHAQAAIEALLQVGFARQDIDILHGEEDFHRPHPTGAEHRFLAQFRRTLIRTLGDNTNTCNITSRTCGRADA